MKFASLSALCLTAALVGCAGEAPAPAPAPAMSHSAGAGAAPMMDDKAKMDGAMAEGAAGGAMAEGTPATTP